MHDKIRESAIFPLEKVHSNLGMHSCVKKGLNSLQQSIAFILFALHRHYLKQ